MMHTSGIAIYNSAASPCCAVLTIDCPELLQTLGAEVVDLLPFIARQRRPFRLLAGLPLEGLEQERAHYRVADHQAAQAHVREQVREEHLDVVAQPVALLVPLSHRQSDGVTKKLATPGVGSE